MKSNALTQAQIQAIHGKALMEANEKSLKELEEKLSKERKDFHNRSKYTKELNDLEIERVRSELDNAILHKDRAEEIQCLLRLEQLGIPLPEYKAKEDGK